MLDWLQDNSAIAIWLTVASVVMCVASLIITAVLVVKLPADYFAHDKRPPHDPGQRSGIALRIAKNILGAILVIAGIILIMLPGQGILTILVGVMLLDIPGKYRFEKWIVSRGKVLKAMNWLRAKRHKEPLRVNNDKNSGDPARLAPAAN